MNWLVTLVAFPSISAFVRGDVAPSLHVVADGNDKRRTRGKPQGEDVGRERGARLSVFRITSITKLSHRERRRQAR